MIHFFKKQENTFYAVAIESTLDSESIDKLKWLFGNAEKLRNRAFKIPL